MQICNLQNEKDESVSSPQVCIAYANVTSKELLLENV